MDIKISRNAPCPCGSGKKYKKCCGANEVISLTQVLETEIDDLQRQLLHFALRNFENELDDNFESFQQEFFLNSEDEIKFFEFVHTVWFTLFAKTDNGETIVDRFIAAELKKIKRPKLKQIVQSWKKARVIAGKIIMVKGNNYTIEDLFTNEQLEAIVVTKLDKQYGEGIFFSGILLPFDQKYVFFPAPFELPELDYVDAIKFIESSMEESDYDNPQDFYTDFFMEMMYELPTVGVGVKIAEMEWSAPIYQVIAERFQERLQVINVEQDLIDMGVCLWNLFCQKRQKRIKNPNIYVAALHYFVSTIAPIELELSQKKLAELYGVSVGSLSSVYRELDDILAEELDEEEQQPSLQFATKGSTPLTERALQGVMEEIQDHNFESVDEINEFLSKKMAVQPSTRLKDDAQEMLYDAFEAEGAERYRLAEKALKLNPNLVDAYNILAENADNIEEAIQMYEKGMWIGQKSLGKTFFKENKGHFWGIFETRPFMRAKYNYAEALLNIGKINEAIVQFEELLELNPQDNQGVRDSLFVAYMDLGNLTKARKLLEKYDDGNTSFFFNQLLLELLDHGFTARAKTFLKKAKECNKFVVPYIIGKKHLPKVIPDYYGFGDENEAIVYAQSHLHLWKRIVGIKEWLK